MPTGIKVALIDDSAVVRKHLTDQPSEAGIEVLFRRNLARFDNGATTYQKEIEGRS